MIRPPAGVNRSNRTGGGSYAKPDGAAERVRTHGFIRPGDRPIVRQGDMTGWGGPGGQGKRILLGERFLGNSGQILLALFLESF